MGELILGLCLVLLVISILILLVWSGPRSAKMVHKWASRNGLRIMKMKRRFLRVGPFSIFYAVSSPIYHVVVQTIEGEVRSGWIKCGSYSLGILADDVVVSWNCKQRQDAPR